MNNLGGKLYGATNGAVGETLVTNSSSIGSGISSVGSALNYLDAAMSAGAGKWGSAIGQAFGTYVGGPLGGIVGKFVGGVVDDLFDGGGGAQNTGDAQARFSAGGGLNSITSQYGISKTAASTIKSMSESYAKYASSLGITTAAAEFGYGSNDSRGGQVITTSEVNGKRYDSGEVLNDQLSVVAARAVFNALKASDMPQYLRKVFDTVDTSKMSDADVQSVLDYAGSLKALRDSMQSSTTYVEDLKKSASEGFSAVGTSVKTFKTDLVAAIDAGMSPAQLEKWNALAVQMNLIADATGDETLRIRSQIDILKEKQGLQDELDKLTLTSAQLLEKQREALDASNQALFDQIQAENSQRKLNELARTRLDLEAQYIALSGDIRAARAADARALAAQRAEESKDLNDVQRAAYDYSSALKDQIQLLQDIESAAQAVESALDGMKTAVNAAESVRGEATSAYVSALADVESAQKKVADVQLKAQTDLAKAANDAAKQMEDLSKQLYEFINGTAAKPDQLFATTLKAALGGDKDAMKALPSAAKGAIDSAMQNSGSASDFALLQGRILAQVTEVAKIADAAAANTVALPTEADPAVAAAQELAKAQATLREALTVATAIGAPLTQSVTSLITKFQQAQADIAKANAEVVAAQLTLEAISGSTSTTAKNTYDTIAAVSGGNVAMINQLTTNFTKLDTSLDGILSKDEFMKGLAGKATDSELQVMWKRADVNSDGQTTLLDWIKAYGAWTADNTLATSTAVSGVKAAILSDLVSSVSAIDLNKDGLLTIDEFQRGMSGKASDAQLLNIFNQADTNHDGVISRLEAVAANTAATALSASMTATNTLSSAATSVVQFSASDPIHSVFDNISKTNNLLIDGMRLQLAQFLGQMVPQNMVIDGNLNNTMFDGAYKVWVDSRDHLKRLVDVMSGLVYITDNINTYTVSMHWQMYNGAQRMVFQRDNGSVYAAGGAFTNGIVTRPTFFNESQMGEAGPEAIVPLVNVGGSLGVRAAGGLSTEELVAEIRALREEQRAQASAMVRLMQRQTKLSERWDTNGMPETRVTA